MWRKTANALAVAHVARPYGAGFTLNYNWVCSAIGLVVPHERFRAHSLI